MDKLAALVMSYTVWWCVDADAAEMYARSRGNFFDLKVSNHCLSSWHFRARRDFCDYCIGSTVFCNSTLFSAMCAFFLTNVSV